MNPVERLLDRLEGVRESNGFWKALCPAHDDREQSLSVSEGDDGRALLRCFAGCEAEEIVAELGLQMKDLFECNGDVPAPPANANPRRQHKPANYYESRRVVEPYRYTDGNGNLLFQVLRYEPKGFRQRKPDPTGGWTWNLRGVEPVLYRLPKVLEAASAGGTVYVVEGEKDVHRLEREELTATTNPAGAGKWKDSYSKSLEGAHVILLPDNDDPGRKHAQMVAESLRGKAASVRAVELPRLPKGGDVSDWFDDGGRLEELTRLVAASPEYRGPAESSEGENMLVDVDSSAPLQLTSPRWPTLAEEALYGLPGEIVKAIEPHTEADPVAILVNLLAAFGNATGREAFLRIGADYHRLNLYAAFVGETAKGRKGTSWGHPKELMHAAEPSWIEERVMNGLSSGEGLIYAVRDRVMGEKDGEQVVVDEGVEDKRLFVMEGEFASVLKVMGREGNTLSPIIRQGWDGDRLQVLTRNNPMKSTSAHISIIGHITKTELLRHLTGTETANGFANRFIWLLVRRSKILPFGGEWHTVDTAPVVKRLRSALDFAAGVGEITWAKSAREAWSQVYGVLSEGKPGLYGAVVGRAEAQVLRLAALYAAMDKSHYIEREHLEAALALWDYTEESVRYIFGDATGDSVADSILEALRAAGENGMTRTEIRNLFGRNKLAERIEQALILLLDLERAYEVSEETGGRPAEKWFAR
ncbi:MAG: DUF3987 domain-containing protein [Rubrobacteraceae bacterium]